jgi:hypothetical protein
MTQHEQIEVLQALLATLAVRAGGRITLPVRELLRCSRKYLFWMQGDEDAGTLTVGVRKFRLRLFRPHLRRHRRHSPNGPSPSRPA